MNFKNFPIFTVAGVFVISGALLATNGCDRSSAKSPEAVGANAGAATVDQNPPIAVSSALPANPSAVLYVSSTDAGQALVSGTSTLHDWSVKSTAIQGNAGFSGQWKADSVATITPQSINLVIPVDSLKSTEGSGMDNNMYDALNLKQFPTITYSLTSATLKTSPSTQGSAYHFDTTGQLTIAGAAHPVNLDLGVLPHDDGQLTITTEISLKMTDYGVKPPTAMLGVIKSGDAITVKVNWQLTMQTPVARAEK